MNQLLFSLLILTVTFSLTSSKTVQVPYVTNDNTIDLRFQELTRVDKVFNVFGHLNRIYRKEVYQLSPDGSETEFPACYEEPPQANFWANSQLLLEGRKIDKDGLIYDFDLIKYPRNLIDVEVFNKKIYYVKEDGTITIAEIADDLSKIVAKKRIKTEENKLAEGNIVILPDATDGQKVGFGIFITRNQAVLFDLNGDNFTQLSSFKAMKGFQSTIPLQGNFFAAAFGEDGCNIFSIDFAQKQLKVEHSFTHDFFNLKSINIQDLAYDSNRKLLFILDHNTGVTPVQLLIQGSTLEARATSSTIKNTFCNVIYYDSYNDQLYLNCRELHKYMIKDWPLITEKVLPRQEITIKQITSNKGVVALVGRNVFELISEERRVSVYDDQLLDKLIVQDNMFVSGNQNYFLVGKYEIVPPALTCSPTQSSAIGKHKVLFKITAQCNAEYLSSIKFPAESIGKDDKCVYSVYQNVKIWKGKSLDVKIFMAFALVVGLIGVIVLIWWGCSYLNLRKLKNYLHHYRSLEDGQEGQISSTVGEKPFDGVIEVKEEPIQKVTDKQGRHELNEDVEVPADIHDIE